VFILLAQHQQLVFELEFPLLLAASFLTGRRLIQAAQPICQLLGNGATSLELLGMVVAGEH